MARLLTVLAFVTFTAATANVLTADWSPDAAARYLDERQKQWFEWKAAASANGPCVSCHTGMTYLLARPALRRVLKEAQPTVYERGLLDRLRSNAGAKPPGALQEVETIFTAMFLAQQDDRGAMSPQTQKAFEQLWSLQQSDGPVKGAWKWYAANLDPWEHSGSSYFGASLAMLAFGSTPRDYQQRTDMRERAAAAAGYLAMSSQRPLHDRLALLWASSVSPSVLPEALRAPLVAEVSQRSRPMEAGRRQRSDRGRRIRMRHLQSAATPTQPALPHSRSGRLESPRHIRGCPARSPGSDRIRTHRPAPGPPCP